MKDTKKTKEQLMDELVKLRQQITELQKSEIKHRQVEETLRENEGKYRTLVEMATDAIFIQTVEGRMLECNVPEEFAKTLPSVITEKETTRGIFLPRISKKKDGSIFPTEIASKIINIGGKPRLIAYVRDITKRKRAEKKRKSLLKKEREQHLKAETLAKAALILTSKLSLSDVLKEVLRQVKRLIPYSACHIALIKKRRLSNIHSVGYEKYGSKAFIDNFTYSLDKVPLEKEVVKKARPLLISDTHQDSRWIIFKETSWVRACLIVPICLGNKVIGLLNLDDNAPGKFVKDDIKKLQPLVNAAAIALENARLFEEVQKEITERKQAEELFKSFFTYSPNAIFIIQDGKYKLVNPKFEEETGYTKKELLNKDSLKFLHPADKEMVRERVIKNLKKRISSPFEFRGICKNGKIKWGLEVVTSITYQGKKAILGNFKDITKIRQAEKKLQQSYEKLQKTMDATIDTMSRIIEAKDPYTSGHQRRVCQLAVPIAQEMKLPEDKIEGIRIASLIHDIGKIGLPAEILSKPTKLADIEFSLIKGHSQIGYDILKSIDFSYPVAQIVLQHHERINGSGYPNNLKGDEILLEARILGVADVVEAMSSHRPYRPARGIDKALEEIIQNKGTLYDPEVVDVCLKLFKEKGFKFE